MSLESSQARLASSLAAAAIVAILIVPRTIEYSQADVVPDLDTRGLVVVDAPLGPRDWSLRAWLKFGDEGENVLTLAAHSAPIDGEQWDPFALPLDIAFFGDGAARVACKGLEQQDYDFEALPEGIQAAVKVDLGSRGVASALNPISATSVPETSTETEEGIPNAPEPLDQSLETLDGVFFTADIWAEDKPWKSESDVQTDGDNSYIWTIECSLPEEMVVAQPVDSSWPYSKVRAIFPPQVNLVSSESSSQEGFFGKIETWTSVARRDKLVLEESYPPATLSVFGWNQSSEIRDHQLSSGSMQYTLPGTLIFSERGWASSRSLELALLGAGYGFLGTSLAVALQSFISLALHRRENRGG